MHTYKKHQLSQLAAKYRPRLVRRWGCFASVPLLCGLFLLTFIPPSLAQQSLRIAAIVNDEMISVFDLQARISLVAAFSGISNSPETQQRLAPQVLQSLIDEHIRMQEAKRLEITASKQELESEQALIEKQINIKPGELLKSLESNGIKSSTLIDQLEAKIVWTKIIRGQFGRTIQISDEEVDEVIEQIKENKGKPENLVSEIFLPIESDQKAEDTTQLATRLIQQIDAGADFSAVARNFSQSTSAQNGGTLGWNRIGELGSEIDPVIQRLNPGEISAPVRTADGIYIFQLRARRLSTGLEGPPPGPIKVTLKQLHLEAGPQYSTEQIEQVKRKAQSLTATVQSCDSFETVAKQSGSSLSGELGTFAINQLTTQMQSLVKDLPIGQPSAPYFAGDGVIILMVCERIVPQAEPINIENIRNGIRNNLTASRLTLAARRHLRDLRRASFIDIRL